MLKTEWLAYFVALSQCRSFKRAAEQLNITQQALSKNIAKLEAYLGVRLVERSRKFQGLTPAGEVFLQQAQASLSQLEHALQCLQDHQAHQPAGELKIGWVNAWGYGLLPQYLQQFAQAYPDVCLRLYGMSTPYIESFLLEGKLDLGFGIQAPSHSDFISLRFPHQICYKIVSAHPESLPWQALRYIVWETINPVKNTAFQWDDNLYPRQIVATANSYEGLLQLCKAGLGAIYVPEPVVREELARGNLYAVAEPPFEQYLSLYVFYHATRYRSAALRCLLDQLYSELET